MSWAKRLLTLAKKDSIGSIQDMSLVLEPEHSVARGGSRVMTTVFEQHPNLSVFYPPTDRPIPLHSQPNSDPLAREFNSFRDPPPENEHHSQVIPQLDGQQLPETLISQLVQVQSTIGIGNPHENLVEPPHHSQPHTPATRKSSISSTPSIMREPNTPGTGQKSVRFFSRNAYRVISPDLPGPPEEPILGGSRSAQPSSSVQHSSPVDDKSLPTRQSHGPLTSPTSFSPDSSHFFPLTLPGSNNPNLFDMSLEMPPITTPGFLGGIMDDAIEVPDFDVADGSASYLNELPSTSKDSRDPALSKDATVYMSMFDPSVPVPLSIWPDSCNPPRLPIAHEGTISHSIQNILPSDIHHGFPSSPTIPPSTNPFVLDRKPVNPTQICALPIAYDPPMSLANLPLPPSQSVYQLISSQDEIISSLQSQIAIQREISEQLKVDLESRDKAVGILSDKLEIAEKGAASWKLEGERRKSAMRTWKKRIAELESLCMKLESEVAISREEKADRSIMDIASHEALKVLHNRIKRLEGVRLDLESKTKDSEIRLEQERELVIGLKAQLEHLADRKQVEWNQSKVPESAVIASLRVRLSEVQVSEDLARAAVEDLQQQLAAVQTERAELLRGLGDQTRARDIEKAAITREKDAFASKCAASDEELAVLTRDCEVQWHRAEIVDQKHKALLIEKERVVEEFNTLTEEKVICLRRRTVLEAENKLLMENSSRLELTVQNLENTVAALKQLNHDLGARVCSADEEIRQAGLSREETVAERNHLAQHLQQVSLELQGERKSTECLTNAVSQLENRVVEIERNREFAEHNVTRLEQLLQHRDCDLAKASTRIYETERKADDLQTQVERVQKELGRVVADQVRKLEEAGRRESEFRKDMETLVRERANAELSLENLNEKAEKRGEEVERLRRRVHELEQESADKEVKLAHGAKCRAQDLEDKEGLNIALDSKQQELELLKRRLGVKGTAGGTPAYSRVRQDAHRCESSLFNTPIPSRPPSASNNRDVRPRTETPGAPAALRNSRKSNAIAGTVKPPPLGKQARLADVTPLTPRRGGLNAVLTPGASAMRAPFVRRTSATVQPSIPTGLLHKRTSSSLSKPISIPCTTTTPVAESGTGEKENYPTTGE